MKLFKKMKVLLLAFVILFSTSSCIKNPDNFKEIYQGTGALSEAIPLKNEFNESDNAPVQNPDLIDETEKIIQILTSEEFKGRASDTDGNDKAVEYLNSQFENIGLDYLFKDTYLHKYKFKSNINAYKIIDPDGEKSNVVGLIKGTNHSEKSKAVVITAHFDHIGRGFNPKDDKTIHPGAVDNASGTAVLLRIAHKIKEMSKETPFETDIIVAAVNHEEIGYIGSRALINDIKE